MACTVARVIAWCMCGAWTVVAHVVQGRWHAWCTDGGMLGARTMARVLAMQWHLSLHTVAHHPMTCVLANAVQERWHARCTDGDTRLGRPFVSRGGTHLGMRMLCGAQMMARVVNGRWQVRWMERDMCSAQIVARAVICFLVCGGMLPCTWCHLSSHMVPCVLTWHGWWLMRCMDGGVTRPNTHTSTRLATLGGMVHGPPMHGAQTVAVYGRGGTCGAQIGARVLARAVAHILACVMAHVLVCAVHGQ